MKVRPIRRPFDFWGWLGTYAAVFLQVAMWLGLIGFLYAAVMVLLETLAPITS